MCPSRQGIVRGVLAGEGLVVSTCRGESAQREGANRGVRAPSPSAAHGVARDGARLRPANRVSVLRRRRVLIGMRLYAETMWSERDVDNAATRRARHDVTPHHGRAHHAVQQDQRLAATE